MFHRENEYYCVPPGETIDGLVNECPFKDENNRCRFPGRCVYRRDKYGNRKMEL